MPVQLPGKGIRQEKEEFIEKHLEVSGLMKIALQDKIRIPWLGSYDKSFVRKEKTRSRRVVSLKEKRKI